MTAGTPQGNLASPSNTRTEMSLRRRLLMFLLLPLIPLPLPEAWEPVEVPERFARLIREARPLPPTPPPQREEIRPEEKPPEPLETPQKVVEESRPEPGPKAPAPSPESKGILAFREKISGLASGPVARLGSQDRKSTRLNSSHSQ